MLLISLETLLCLLSHFSLRFFPLPNCSVLDLPVGSPPPPPKPQHPVVFTPQRLLTPHICPGMTHLLFSSATTIRPWSLNLQLPPWTLLTSASGILNSARSKLNFHNQHIPPVFSLNEWNPLHQVENLAVVLDSSLFLNPYISLSTKTYGNYSQTVLNLPSPLQKITTITSVVLALITSPEDYCRLS